MRMLWRLRLRNQRWRRYDAFLVGENRWRAQRYGVTEGLIDFGAGRITPFPELVEELIALVEEDAATLRCLAEVERARQIAAEGASASRQRHALTRAEEAGGDAEACMRAVVTHLVEEFHADL
jgi:carboxylate-amine ligase